MSAAILPGLLAAGNILLPILLVSALAVGIVSLLGFLLRDRLIARLIYSRRFGEEGVYEGEGTTLTEVIRNPSFLPVFFVDVEAYFYDGLRLTDQPADPRGTMQYARSRFHLLPFMQITRTHPVACTKRGDYRLETVDIFYRRRVRYLAAPAGIFVYPKIVPVEGSQTPLSQAQGESVTAQRLLYDPFSVNGVRSYRFGDPLHSINFKATARSGRYGTEGIRVNSRDFCSDRTVFVCLNFQLAAGHSIPTPAYEQMMEGGLSYAAALLREAIYGGNRAGFAANCLLVSGEKGISIPTGSGEEHLKNALKQMARARCAFGLSFAGMLASCLREGVMGHEIYILTPELTEETDALLSRLALQGNVLHPVLLTGGPRTEEAAESPESAPEKPIERKKKKR